MLAQVHRLCNVVLINAGIGSIGSTVGIVLTSPTRRATEVAAVCTWHWAQRPNAICLGWSLAFSHALYIEAMIPSIRLQNAAPEPERILQQRSSSLTSIVYSAPSSSEWIAFHSSSSKYFQYPPNEKHHFLRKPPSI